MVECSNDRRSNMTLPSVTVPKISLPAAKLISYTPSHERSAVRGLLSKSQMVQVESMELVPKKIEHMTE